MVVDTISSIRKRPFFANNIMLDRLPYIYIYWPVYIWLVVSTPLKNISQIGVLFPIYGKITHVPNHQSDIYIYTVSTGGLNPSQQYVHHLNQSSRVRLKKTWNIGWGPKDSVQLRYVWLNSIVYGCLWIFMDVYGCLWMFMVYIYI